MKVCLIAQIENWRGGIQQYSQNYAEALVQKTETCVIGYHSYFPTWLYPGDKEKINKQHRKLKDGVTVYNVLKYYSLFSVYKTFQLIRKKLKADIVDIQWCTTFHAPILIPLVILLKYFSNVSIFLTVHNVLPHENRFFDKRLCSIIYHLSDRLVVHTKSMKQDLIDMFGISREKVFIIPHGICAEHKSNVSNKDAKSKLGIKEERVILFFGLVRKYKGLDCLLEAFRVIKDDFDVALLIAGDFVEEKEKYEKMIVEYGIKEKTYVHSRYISDEEVPLFFSAADLVVQPYRNFSGQSGVCPTAYYYSKPIIATRVGGLPEIVVNKRTGLIIQPENLEMITQAIRYFLQNPEKIKEYGANGKYFLETELSWESIAGKMLKIYSNGMSIQTIKNH